MNWHQFIASWKTSVIGFMAGVVWYLYTSGAELPKTKDDAWHLVIGLLFAGFGFLSKDADKGATSAPTPTNK